ncbi:MAG: glycosyltransferase family 2 protein [Luteolibacter sp.]
MTSTSAETMSMNVALGDQPRRLAAHMAKLAALSGTPADDVCRNTLVIIPALNESANIGGVLSVLRCWPLAAIRVVDNGSADDTVVIAASKGAEVIHEPTRGYGAACWTGMQNLPESIEWILFCDADGCDNLWDLAPFFESAASGHDLILGNRNALPQSRASLTWPQRFGNALAGRLIWLRWGTRFDDLGPLRLIRRSSLERIHMEDRGFGWTVEMQAKAAAMKFRTREIPVSYFPRRGGKSKISGTVSGTIMAGSVILGTLAKLWMRRTSHD